MMLKIIEHPVYNTRSNLEAFSVLEKKIFKCFLPYMGIADILFNDAVPFEQTDTSSTESPV